MSRVTFWLSGPLAVSCRSFKTKTSVAQEAAAKKAAAAVAGGRDPYGLFKQAIVSPPDPDNRSRKKRLPKGQMDEHRKAYSRALMLEVRTSCISSRHLCCIGLMRCRADSQNHRVNGHFTKMIAMREAVRAARLYPPVAVACAPFRATAQPPTDRRAPLSVHASAGGCGAPRGPAAGGALTRPDVAADPAAHLHGDGADPRLPSEAFTARRSGIDR